MPTFTREEPPVADQHVTETVETIARLHARGEEGLSRRQRSVEAITRAVSTSATLFVLVAGAAGWVVVNLACGAMHRTPIDPPPFPWLQLASSLGALLMASTVLTTQNRQRKVADGRAQLDLQVNLLAEQKVAKLIALVEELRRDMPNVQNRADPLAEAMTHAVDPHAVATAIEESIEAAVTKGEPPSQRAPGES
jgi:uncharacterized membrane protein